MTVTIAKIIYVLMAVGWYIVRLPHARRARRTPVAHSSRDWRELLLLTVSLTGLGVLPFVYIATNALKFANYTFNAPAAYLGAILASVAIWLFYQTHKQLGRNWSVSLDLRDRHQLITDGVYRQIRHPMYSAFWLWALAQLSLLPNFIAGTSGVFGFGLLYLYRVGREERMMTDRFGKEYESYMARTGRLIPKWL